MRIAHGWHIVVWLGVRNASSKLDNIAVNELQRRSSILVDLVPASARSSTSNRRA